MIYTDDLRSKKALIFATSSRDDKKLIKQSTFLFNYRIMKKVILSMVMCFALLASTAVMAQSATKAEKKPVATEAKAEKKAEAKPLKTEVKKAEKKAESKAVKTEKKATSTSDTTKK